MARKPTILGSPGSISVSSIRKSTVRVSGVWGAVFSSDRGRSVTLLLSKTGLSLELEPILV